MYKANHERYNSMKYARCGNSGLKLPRVALGMWHNFGGVDRFENSREMALGAFDMGITHFDLANNYGPPAGSAEETLGQILKNDLAPYRDELIISTKAGYGMWAGPYGDGGSKKYLVASLDQSLRRMGLDYVDIFYSHRFDPSTPLEETMDALAGIVKSGKALYVGISNYSPEQTAKAYEILRGMGVKFLIHQMSYSMFNRGPEGGLFDVLDEKGVGSIAFCPLAKGLLTDRYFAGIPADSRAAGKSVFLKESDVTEAAVNKAKALNEIAAERGQTLAQMALAWALRGGRLTSVIIGASRISQIRDNVGAVNNLDFSDEELARIEAILAK